MRIGINARFVTAPVGGVQRFAHGVTEQLIGRADVVILAPRGARVPQAWHDRAEVAAGRLSGQLWEQFELPRTAARCCDALFHPANTAPASGPPSVLMLHDVFPLAHPEWYGRAFALWYRAVVPAAARRASTILTTSAHTAARITDALSIGPERIRAVPQGLEPFAAPALDPAVHGTLHVLGVRRPYVLVPGAGDARKNVHFAQQVVALLTRCMREPLTLAAFGSTRMRVHGRDAAIRGDTIRRLGHVRDDQLHALYTGAAAVLCPSLDEGFGRVPLEAMACGTPCIVAQHEAAAEVLADTPARRLPLEPHAWAAALWEILVQHERVGRAAREQLRGRWSWEAAAAVVLEACEAAAGARAGGV